MSAVRFSRACIRAGGTLVWRFELEPDPLSQLLTVPVFPSSLPHGALREAIPPVTSPAAARYALTRAFQCFTQSARKTLQAVFQADMSGPGVSATSEARYSPACALLFVGRLPNAGTSAVPYSTHHSNVHALGHRTRHSVQWTSSQLSSDPGVKASCQTPTSSICSQGKFVVLSQRRRRLPLCTDLWRQQRDLNCKK
ncbi:uncharacterized protein LOC144109516 [Amblyomma americanum]